MREKKNETANLKEVLLRVCLSQLLVVLYYIESYMAEEREREWKRSFFLYFVCLYKEWKRRSGGMLGLGQRDGVAYKRITPNIRQNKQTYFVFTSFSFCFLFFFSCFACCFCCCFSCTTSFWHFPTLGKETPLPLSLRLVRKKMGKKSATRPLPHDACAVKLYSIIIGRWRMHNRQNPIPFRFISMYATATVKNVLCPSFASNIPFAHAVS